MHITVYHLDKMAAILNLVAILDSRNDLKDVSNRFWLT